VTSNHPCRGFLLAFGTSSAWKNAVLHDEMKDEKGAAVVRKDVVYLTTTDLRSDAK
jgi:hypothetical protein